MDENKKENCCHAINDYERKGFYVRDLWFCNIGKISDCKNCIKFYHYDWLKSDMESEELTNAN